MSPLASAPLRTAKGLRKAKEIHHVKQAIKWHDRERKKRQAIASDRYESKQAVLQRVRWEKDNVTGAKRRALKAARLDWQLGPLRPNRAVGQGASKYGALGPEEARRPNIPVRVQKNRNEVREKKGRELEYPLVVDDKKFFHIVQDDRVVVLKGREKGKIGVVDSIVDDTHEITIKDLNTHYVDSQMFTQAPGEAPPPPKRKAAITIDISDVRLVVPYRITVKTATGEGKDIYQDVIVENVLMERHTRGVDPFTGIDHGNDEFPEEHRFDPITNLPIFKRYIAGTRSLIQWPWEKGEELTSVDNKSTEDRPGAMAKARSWISSPLKSLGRSFGKDKSPAQAAKNQSPEEVATAKDLQEIAAINEQIELAQQSRDLDNYKSQPNKQPPDYEDDTSRNKVEPSDETRSFYPTLVYPPFPNELSTELAPHIRVKNWADAKGKDRPSITQTMIENERAEREIKENEKKQKQFQAMKTPMQLRWEVERAKKVQAEKINPVIETDALLLALGQHMQKNGVKLTPKRVSAAEKEAAKAELVD